MNNRQPRTTDLSLFDSVLRKANMLGDAIVDGKIPNRRVHAALYRAMCGAFRHGIVHHAQLSKGKKDRES